MRRTTLGWVDCQARITYIDLKSCEETYSAEGEEAEFEICLIKIMSIIVGYSIPVLTVGNLFSY